MEGKLGVSSFQTTIIKNLNWRQKIFNLLCTHGILNFRHKAFQLHLPVISNKFW